MLSKPARRAIAKASAARDAETIDAGGANAIQPLERHRLRVRFERDLRIRGHRERMATGGDDGLDLVGLEQRRRASAEVDRVGRRSVSVRRDLAEQRSDVALLQRGVKESAIEVAVVADRRAERDVDVEAEHWLQSTTRRGRWL
jgi:phage/plasmid primase-like uncharacterized protein